jgi:lactate dehydrogenase-like 2-hydroxyacid dehydrogenase
LDFIGVDASLSEVPTYQLAHCRGAGHDHLADVPQTLGLLGGVLFASMKENAAFINTGSGATVSHSELIEVLRAA